MERSASPIEELHPHEETLGAPGAGGEPMAIRRPIHDARLRLCALDLVLLERGSDGVPRAELDAATPRAVAAAAAGFGAIHPAHVRMSRETLCGKGVTVLPAERTVPVVTPAVGHDELVVEAVERLGNLGYAVAAEGIPAGEETAALLRACALVRLPVGDATPGELAEEVGRLRTVTGARLVATGVDDHATLERCRDAGFAQFEGFFFLEPVPTGADEAGTDTGGRLQLLAALQRDADLEEIQEIIARDLGLSYRLLRFVNSAFFALPRKIESVHQAAVLLGTSNVGRWGTLSILAESGDGKPGELVTTGLTRAHMCKLLAPAYGRVDPESFFTVGLFSVVDALMGMPMAEVLEALPFAAEVKAAINDFEGFRGHTLRAVIAWERGEFDELRPPPGMALEAISEAYCHSLAWAMNLAAGLR